MRSFFERGLIKILKKLDADLLKHAYVQIGVGHGTFNSGELYVLEYLKKKLKKEPEIIFDVGANNGDYARMVREKFPSAEIFCFEPVPENFTNLIKNTEGFKTHNKLLAMSSKAGEIELYLGENNTDGTMATTYKDSLEIFPYVGDITQTVKSPMSTLDIFCAENKIEKIDFLKIDVEGHELDVLKGAAKLIAENNISVIQFEFNEFNIFSRSFMYDFYKTLPFYNFYRVMPQNRLFPMGEYNRKLELFAYQNILAVHHSLN